MVKRALTLLTSLLIALPLLMPFNIFAEQLPQSEITGVDYNLISYSSNTNNSGVMYYSYTYEVEVKLNNNYVGVVDGTLSYTWTNQDTSTGNPTQHTASNKRKSYVNGNSFKVNIVLQGTYSTFTGKGPLFSVSYLIDNSDTNVVKYEDLNSIESVVNLLSDIYQNSEDIENLSTNQLVELKKIVSNTSLSNDYLETLTKLENYHVPLESYTALNYLLENNEVYLMQELYEYNYPIFNLKINDLIFTGHSTNQDIGRSCFIINIKRNIWNITELEKHIDISSNTEIVNKNFERLNYSGGWSLIKLSLSVNGNDFYNVSSKIDNLQVIPIYIGYTNIKTSIDFALLYGFSNSLLDNINIIVNGTTATQSAADSSQSANEQLQTDSNTLFQQEDSFKSDMNNAMQNVNTTFRLQDMGTKFVSSAQWVRTQYEQLTNNTPFASLITFSLITGLALILLGKVYK